MSGVKGGIGVIASRMTVEGPLKKGKSSLLISGRRTYADLILRPVLKILGEENTGYYFYDMNAKINYDLGKNDRLFLSGYFGSDKFYTKIKSDRVYEDAGFRWGNTTATLRWNHLFSNKMFANTSAIFSNYRFHISDTYMVPDEGKNFYADYNSGVRDFTFKHDIDFIASTKH